MSTSFSCPAFPSVLSIESQECISVKVPEINATALCWMQLNLDRMQWNSVHLASTGVWALQGEKWKICFGRDLDRKEDLIKDLKHTPSEPINNQGIKSGRTVLQRACQVQVLGEKKSQPHSSELLKCKKHLLCVFLTSIYPASKADWPKKLTT